MADKRYCFLREKKRQQWCIRHFWEPLKPKHLMPLHAGTFSWDRHGPIALLAVFMLQSLSHKTICFLGVSESSTAQMPEMKHSLKCYENTLFSSCEEPFWTHDYPTLTQLYNSQLIHNGVTQLVRQSVAMFQFHSLTTVALKFTCTQSHL